MISIGRPSEVPETSKPGPSASAKAATKPEEKQVPDVPEEVKASKLQDIYIKNHKES